jgi:mannosyltransferase
VTADRRNLALLLLAALAAAAALRLYALQSWPLWLDESWSRWMAEQDWAGLRRSAAAYDTHPPVYYSALKLWLGLARATPLGMRMLSVLAGLAMLPLAWLCAREIGLLRADFGGKAFAMAAVAASPPLVVAARQARPYALFALAFGLALWAALRLVRADDSPRARIAIWILYGLALEAVLWLHSLGALFAAGLGGGLFLALALAGRLRPAVAPFLAVHALAGLAWLPGLLVILEHGRNWSVTWLRFFVGEVPAGLASGLALAGAGALLIFAAAALGFFALARSKADRPAAMLLLCAAFAPAALAILLSILSSPVFLPRTLIPSALPLLLLAAAGVASLGGRAVRVALAAAILLLLGWASILHISRPPEEKWDRLAAWLGPRVAPGEEVWLLPNEIILPLRYAQGGEALAAGARGVPAPFPAPNHRGPRYTGTIAVPGVTRDDAARIVADARGRGIKGVWVVSRFPSLFDPGGALPKELGRGSRDLREIRFAPLLIDHYRLAPPLPPELPFNRRTGGRF